MSWIRVYRLALRALPEVLRQKHGDAMEALLARELRLARERGRFRRALVGVRAVWDVVRRGVYERTRRGPGERQRRVRGDGAVPPSGVGRGASGGSPGGTLSGGMDAVRQDLAYSLRSLARAPTFTVVVVLSLAVGVGANSAIFSVLDAVILQPLPFPDAGRVVHLAWDGGTYVQSDLTPVRFDYWREHARTLDGVATWRSPLVRLEEGERASAVRSLTVSRDFFSVVGSEPALGRAFAGDEYVPDGPSVALVSDALARARFGTSSEATGRTIDLDGVAHTIVGVLPASFAFPYVDERVGVVTPLGWTVDPSDEGANWPALARLRDGVSPDEALAEMIALREPFRAAYPHQVYEGERGMTFATFSELYVGSTARGLWILMGAVALVLLIVCSNVANLFLARAIRRRGEIALRTALGATRGRIARLVLMECALVSVASAGLGLLLARWAGAALVALAPVDLPRIGDVGVDWRVMLFAVGAALGAGLLLGGVAAWPAASTRQSEVLKESGRTSSGRGRLRQGLLVAQTALSMVLLVGAGLLVVTLVGLRRVDAGFEPDGLIAVRFPFKPDGYEESSDLWDLERRVLERLRGDPALAAVAGASNLPLERGINFPMSIGGRPDAYEGAVEWRAVTPGYFETLRIPLVSGKTFGDADVEGAPPVAIVNAAFAARYFPDESPLGQRIEIGRFRGEFLDPSLEGPGAEIIGVVADIREVSLRADPRRTVYVPQAQAPTRISDVLGSMPVFLARASSAGGDAARALVDAVEDADPALPTPEVVPFSHVVASSLVRERFGAVLLSAFAALALALTTFGIYGVLAYTVRQQRREIGIRMALGAVGGDVARLVMAHAVAPVLIGITLGSLGSLGLSSVVAGLLWGVAPTDPRTIASVAAILLGAALVASWIPAREAMHLDPVDTLRPE